MNNTIKIVVIAITVMCALNVYAYNSAEEIKSSDMEIEKLTKAVSKLDEAHKMRVILDVSGGINKLLKNTYKNGTENDYQLSYSFALTHLATLTEQMGFHKATACHSAEAEFMFKSSQTDNDDFSKMPNCRFEIYNAGARANAIALMTSNKDNDKKYNIMAGSLIKQITINSYYTTKLLRAKK